MLSDGQTANAQERRDAYADVCMHPVLGHAALRRNTVNPITRRGATCCRSVPFPEVPMMASKSRKKWV